MTSPGSASPGSVQVLEVLVNMDKLSILKKKRALKKGNLTRTRRRAFVLIDSRGSKRELNCILKDLDEALNDVLEVNLEYVSILEDEEELKSATEYEQQVTEECNEAQERIKEHLKSRSDEAPSAVSRSQASAKSRGSHRSVTSEASAKAKQAEIDAKVLQLETDQLASRQSQERENEDVKRQLLLQEKKDATAAAKLRAELSKAAENDLTWERRNDFVEETAKEPKQDVITTKSVPANNQVSATSRPVSAEPTESIFMRSLPRLQLTKFSGSSGEWPRWIALFRALVGDQPSLTKTEKMAHLQSAVTGPAQQTIAGMMFNGDLYDTALKALEDRFGREQDVVHATLSAVFACPAPRYMDAEALDRFQSTVALSCISNGKYGVFWRPTKSRKPATHGREAAAGTPTQLGGAHPGS